MSKSKKILLGIAGFIVLWVIGLFSILGYVFSDTIIEEYSSIEVKQLPQKNPTVYIFNGKLEDVRPKIISGIKFPEYDSPYPFKYDLGIKNQPHKSNVKFYICEAKEEICLGTDDKKVKEIFDKQENRNDIYLASDGTRINSTTYYAVGKSLEFRTDFHLHLEAQADNKVKVTVIPINPMVFKGYGGLGLHGGMLKKPIPVEPTTVEEYQLLRYIGFLLNENNMPEVMFPVEN